MRDDIAILCAERTGISNELASGLARTAMAENAGALPAAWRPSPTAVLFSWEVTVGYRRQAWSRCRSRRSACHTYAIRQTQRIRFPRRRMPLCMQECCIIGEGNTAMTDASKPMLPYTGRNSSTASTTAGRSGSTANGCTITDASGLPQHRPDARPAVRRAARGSRAAARTC